MDIETAWNSCESEDSGKQPAWPELGGLAGCESPEGWVDMLKGAELQLHG